MKLLMMSFVLLTSLNAQEIRVSQTKVLSPFVRDNAKEVVINTKTGLMWQDNEAAQTVRKDWQGAKYYCKSLIHAGYSDWYLPTIKELESIAESENYPKAIVKSFQNVAPDGYWSSSADKSDSKYAWSVNFEYGYSVGHSNIIQVRCVRAGQ